MKTGKTWVIILLSVLVIGIFLKYYLKEQRCRIKNSPSFTVGKILRINTMAKTSSIVIVYQFEHNGKFYKDDKLYSDVPVYSEDQFLGRAFAIAYQRSDPSNNDILISEADYNYYKLNMPDSLSWVKQYIE